MKIDKVKRMKKITASAKQTRDLAKKLASSLKGGEVICLFGQLGTGKTIFVKGLAQGLGIRKIVTSPTFVLMKIYPVGSVGSVGSPASYISYKIKYLCHVDAYRLAKGQELLNLGINDWLGKEQVVTVIEWADRVREILPKKRINIKMDFGKEENKRIININN